MVEFGIHTMTCEANPSSIASIMERLKVENTAEDELRQEIARSTRQAGEMGLKKLRDTIERFTKTAYLHKSWLTLEEAVGCANITTTTLREWRNSRIVVAEVGGRPTSRGKSSIA